MKKYVLPVVLSVISAAAFAQEKAPKKEVIYRKIEIKGNDTIVDVTKNYDQLSEAERKDLDQLKEIRITPDAHRVKVVKKLDSVQIAKLKKEGKWVEADNTDVIIANGHGILMPPPGDEHFFEKRVNKKVQITVDSTGKKKVIVLETDGDDDELMPPPGMPGDDIVIERVPRAKGDRMMFRKHFSPEYELNFKLPTKGAILVKVKDETGKEVFKETVNNFSGNFSKTIELFPGKYLLLVQQKGKEVLSYSFFK
ncbi:hypothetical protein C3K47_00750 [Solitalea longa]|uniref:Secretion system C-terminal sorting domain-containing protein n=1 Tax=Solitalea longa TaxID=2079460 RepID=A0A2S5A8Z2_9SPHI|nr:hypothetical protein [Solitalea longa]POY39061.1 hypothetical protein C3K47_00750 [Solitalea longa]